MRVVVPLIAMALVLSVAANVAVAAENVPATVLVKAGSVDGKLMDGVGNAVSGVAVKVREGVPGGIVASTVSGADGAFGLELTPGAYVLVVEGGLSLPLTVTEDAKVRELVLLVPGRSGYAAGQGSPFDYVNWQAVNWNMVGGISALVALPIGIYAAAEAHDAAEDSSDAKRAVERLSP